MVFPYNLFWKFENWPLLEVVAFERWPNIEVLLELKEIYNPSFLIIQIDVLKKKEKRNSSFNFFNIHWIGHTLVCEEIFDQSMQIHDLVENLTCTFLF